VVESGHLILDELGPGSELILIVEGLLLGHFSEVCAKKVYTFLLKSGFYFFWLGLTTILAISWQFLSIFL
jgi:hypothetical protein